MNPVTSPSDFRIITPAEAQERFRVSADVAYPWQDFADEQQIRLYEGGLSLTGGFEAESDGDWVTYNVIVDGDLTVGGDLEWWDSASGNFLLVTGDLRARNVLLSGCPEVAVRGDLTVSGAIQGSYGDDGGTLSVKGATRAQFVICALYFCMSFGAQPEALLIADPYRVNRPVDFDADELDELVLPAAFGKDGSADTRSIAAALRAGEPVLRPGLRPAHLAVLDELDALSVCADSITELDLSGRKLRQLPEQVLAFRRLRVLNLGENESLGVLDERVCALTALEELNLAGTGLTTLPDAIGDLRDLRVLDISDNSLTALPDRLGDLTRLEVLRATRLSCPVPEALGRLSTLRELDLSYLQPGEYNDMVDFPAVVTRMTGLRSLRLKQVWLRAVPGELLALAGLEELDLRGSLSAGLPPLPELARLPRLRVLRLNGSTRWSFQPEPERELLDGVWAITTLEHLEIDRWGEKTRGGQVVRPGLRVLPDDAFARMPGLRRLDLSFNGLTTLPDSLFALAHLEAVDLQYTDVDQTALDRLHEVFPDLRGDLRELAGPAV